MFYIGRMFHILTTVRAHELINQDKCRPTTHLYGHTSLYWLNVVMVKTTGGAVGSEGFQEFDKNILSCL